MCHIVIKKVLAKTQFDGKPRLSVWASVRMLFCIALIPALPGESLIPNC